VVADSRLRASQGVLTHELVATVSGFLTVGSSGKNMCT
jgi:hypothetical protein